MTAKANHATPATSCPAPVVLFGIDSHGKPKGARFGKDHADLAIKAANQLQLRVLASNDPKVAELANQLPVGRVHATGRTFVPFIRRDLYDKLVAAAPNGNAHPTVARRQADPRAPREWGRLAARRPTCPRLGRRSASGIWSSLSKVATTAGTRRLSSKSPVTCSQCAGATTRGNARLCAIGFGLDCCTRDRSRRLTLRKQTRRRQKTKNQLPPLLPPAHNRFREIGSRSTSVNLYWPNQKGRGRRGGRPFRSRKSAMSSSCAGGMGSTSRRALVHGSSWH